MSVVALGATSLDVAKGGNLGPTKNKRPRGDSRSIVHIARGATWLFNPIAEVGTMRLVHRGRGVWHMTS
jgi:hypothetical protein